MEDRDAVEHLQMVETRPRNVEISEPLEGKKSKCKFFKALELVLLRWSMGFTLLHHVRNEHIGGSID